MNCETLGSEPEMGIDGRRPIRQNHRVNRYGARFGLWRCSGSCSRTALVTNWPICVVQTQGAGRLDLSIANTTIEVAKKSRQAIIFTETPWPISSDDKYSMVEEALKLPIEAQDHQRAIADAPVSMPSVCQLPHHSSLKIDRQRWEAVSLGSCPMLLYQILDIDYATMNTVSKIKIGTIQRWLADEDHWTVVRSYQLYLCSETVLGIQVKEIQFHHAYLAKVPENKESWFTPMGLFDFIYDQSFFTSNSWRCQPTTSQYFQSLTP